MVVYNFLRLNFQKCLGILLCCCSYVQGQNLIENGSFENRSDCPFDIGQIHFATGWENPNNGTPDLYCACERKPLKSKEKMEMDLKKMPPDPFNVPTNVAGTQDAYNGNCYAGFFCCNLMDTRKEYIGRYLKEDLKKDKNYCLSFYYSKSDNQRVMITKLGAVFSDKKLKLKKYDAIEKADIEQMVSNDTTKWTKFSTVYKSKGGEKYITIGNFENIEYLKSINAPPVTPNKNNYFLNYSYFLIDEISLVEVNETMECGIPQPVKTILDTIVKVKPVVVNTYLDSAIVKPIIFKSLNFETNKSVILPEAFNDLNVLAEYLKKNIAYKLTISGHTDNQGNEEDNSKLSVARAKAVAEYLAAKGVQMDRMKFFGFGSTQPIADNKTEANRLLNRRVEFKLKK